MIRFFKLGSFWSLMLLAYSGARVIECRLSALIRYLKGNAL
jgi:hypothetical protein